MSFDLYSMEQGELCHSQYRGLLLADYMQDIDAAKSNARGAVVQAPYLSQGFGDCIVAKPHARQKSKNTPSSFMKLYIYNYFDYMESKAEFH